MSRSPTSLHGPGSQTLATPRRISLDCRLSIPAWLPLVALQGALGAIGIQLSALPTRGRKAPRIDAERGARSTC